MARGTAAAARDFQWIMRAAATLALMASIGLSGPALAAESETIDQALCRMIESAAGAHQLPVDFFTRLIWQESSFRPGVTSRAGAQGVAQFMPGTAQERKLADPFDPEQAIPKSAELLSELRARFGNLGLAAAAYNGGSARVENWLERRGGLPGETRSYVALITGRTAEDWAAASRGDAPGEAGGGGAARRPTAATRRERRGRVRRRAASSSWRHFAAARTAG